MSNPEARQAYLELYGREPEVDMRIRYHGGIKGYNASVRKSHNHIEFALSRQFEETETEIRLGVMQLLLNRLYKTKIRSPHIDFYNTFLKKMGDYAPVTKGDPALEASYNRVNNKYFGGMMTLPNLVWGNRSVALLGTYTYATDTIMISRALEDAPVILIDSVMHHEMLHKKHKFNCTTGRTHSHTKAFRDDEALFEPKDTEARLHQYLRGYRRGLRRQELMDGAPVRRVGRPKQPNFVQRVMDWF